jgi:hypothetical protein
MNDIEEAKNQAALLTEFLLTIGKKLKHTQALKAIAHIKGHPTWADFKLHHPTAETQPANTLAELFQSKGIEDLVLGGIAHTSQLCRKDALNRCQQLSLSRERADFVPNAEDLTVPAVLLRREDSSALDIPLNRWLTVEELLFARPRGKGWLLGRTGEFILFGGNHGAK